MMNLAGRKNGYNKALKKATGNSSQLSKAQIEALMDGEGKIKTNQVVEGDCIQLMNAMPENSVDLVFADPPFNIGYLYHGYDDSLKCEDYLKFSEDWMAAVKRVLKPSGAFFLAIGDEYAADLCVLARRKLGFEMRNWIIWHYTFGQQTKMKFARSHTHIFYFTLSDDPQTVTFNADDVRVKSARQTTYADSRANPKGKLPDDTWYLRPQETDGEFFGPDSDTWAISRVCGTFKEREGWHGCQMPVAVLDRIVKAASNPGDLVLDPFNGSGTTVVSAAILGREYLGFELSQSYADFARKRLATTMAQVEQLRNQGREVNLAEMIAIDRESRVKPQVDSFGRPRVERKYRRKKA